MYNIFMLNRHESREKIVFALYQHLLLSKDINECFCDNFEETDLDEFITNIQKDLIINKDNYIYEIGQHLVKWTFDRLNIVEQAILLEATSEIKQNLNDSAVVIDEAIILTKKYCDEESYKYINGVLDNICNK